MCISVFETQYLSDVRRQLMCCNLEKMLCMILCEHSDSLVALRRDVQNHC